MFVVLSRFIFSFSIIRMSPAVLGSMFSVIVSVTVSGSVSGVVSDMRWGCSHDDGHDAGHDSRPLSRGHRRRTPTAHQRTGQAGGASGLSGATLGPGRA